MSKGDTVSVEAAEPRTSALDASRSALLWLALGVLLLVATRYAWIGDDAWFTLRTADNFWRGEGLRWNPVERVQAYTHPLWMMLITLAHGLTGEGFFSTVALSLVTTALAVGLLARRLANRLEVALLCLGVLVLSRSFIDYSTSGLENPLTHALLVGYFIVYDRLEDRATSIRWLAIIAGLIALNRLDCVLLVLPSLCYAALRLPLRQVAVSGWIGALPLLAWHGFALIYYGALVPNTAVSKLGAGIPSAELQQQGLLYLVRQLSFDPLSLGVLLAGLGAGFAVGRDRFKWGAAALGIVLYVGYVVAVGGDFMAGRFLTAPLIAALCVASVRARDRLWGWPEVLPALVAAGLLASLADHPTWRDDLAERPATAGIVDERRHYGKPTSLLGWERGAPPPTRHLLYVQGSEIGRAVAQGASPIQVGGAVGMHAYAAGPDVHFVDAHALADAFLALLPAEKIDSWRVGHYARVLPAGYLESLRSDSDEFLDPKLGRLWSAMRVVRRGPLFSAERWRHIWQLHTGALDELMDRAFYAEPQHARLPARVLGIEKQDGHDARAVDVVRISATDGVVVDFEPRSHAALLRVSLDSTEAFELALLRGRHIVLTAEMPAVSDRWGLLERQVEIPDAVQDLGFDAVHIRGKRTGEHHLGHLLLEPR